MVSAEVGLRPLLVDAKQAARLLGIGRTTLYELINAGAVTTVHIGRCVRFPVAELEGFVARGCATDPDAAHRARASVPADQKQRPRRPARRAAAARLFDVAT
jgi:excisionase family DNA binding protein